MTFSRTPAPAPAHDARTCPRCLDAGQAAALPAHLRRGDLPQPCADATHHNVPGDCWYCHGGCSVCTPDPRDEDGHFPCCDLPTCTCGDPHA